jgi:hypothetical protein
MHCTSYVNSIAVYMVPVDVEYLRCRNIPPSNFKNASISELLYRLSQLNYEHNPGY